MASGLNQHCLPPLDHPGPWAACLPLGHPTPRQAQPLALAVLTDSLGPSFQW